MISNGRWGSQRKGMSEEKRPQVRQGETIDWHIEMKKTRHESWIHHQRRGCLILKKEREYRHHFSFPKRTSFIKPADMQSESKEWPKKKRQPKFLREFLFHTRFWLSSNMKHDAGFFVQENQRPRRVNWTKSDAFVKHMRHDVRWRFKWDLGMSPSHPLSQNMQITLNNTCRHQLQVTRRHTLERWANIWSGITTSRLSSELRVHQTAYTTNGKTRTCAAKFVVGVLHHHVWRSDLPCQSLENVIHPKTREDLVSKLSKQSFKKSTQTQTGMTERYWNCRRKPFRRFKHTADERELSQKRRRRESRRDYYSFTQRFTQSSSNCSTDNRRRRKEQECCWTVKWKEDTADVKGVFAVQSLTGLPCMQWWCIWTTQSLVLHDCFSTPFFALIVSLLHLSWSLLIPLDYPLSYTLPCFPGGRLFLVSFLRVCYHDHHILLMLNQVLVIFGVFESLSSSVFALHQKESTRGQEAHWKRQQ